ncbi:MAG TPA: right-handed parallel beta-helix repeat-containing protein, partial [Methanotrichaceae archaeon]|nr:right-handed parallel beta-helix repeat-containing protein [Methanotrichaceae archaeon]
VRMTLFWIAAAEEDQATNAAYIALMIILTVPAANALSLNIGIGSDEGQSSMSTSYDLDSSSGLADGATLGDGVISSSRYLTGSGNNSITHATFNGKAVLSSNITSAGALISSASTYVSRASARLDQSVFASGVSEIGASGKTGLNGTSQRSGAIDGTISSSQAVSANEAALSAIQSSSIEASAGYINGEAGSPDNSIKVTGGLNGAGKVSGIIAATGMAQAWGSFDAESLDSKAYVAAKAASSESDAFSYTSSNESLSSSISASASGLVDVSQDLSTRGSSLIYASASGGGSSGNYSAKSEIMAEGSMSASASLESLQVINAKLDGDVVSSTSEVTPVPGSWVWSYLGGYISSNPFMMRDALGQRHIFARGGDNGLWDNLDGDWMGLGGKIASDPYAVSDDKGRIHVLARQLDNSVADNVLIPSTLKNTWYNLGGNIGSTPSAVLAPGTTTLNLVCQGKDGDLVQKSLDTKIFQGVGFSDQGSWRSLGGSVKSAPQAVYDSQKRLHAFVRGGDGALWDNVDGTWHNLGGTITSVAKPLAASSDKRVIYTYARGGDGSLVLNTLNTASGTSTWSSLGGYISPGYGSSLFSGKPAPVVDSDGIVHVYVRGGDGALWENANGSWRSLSGRLTSDPTAVNSDGLLEVAVRGTDGSLYLAQPEVYGSWPNPTGNPIGGGVGYKKVISRSDASYVVGDKAGLLSALSKATSGQIIYIDDGASIDLTGSKNILIPAGVTLASGRGKDGSQGALLYITTPGGQIKSDSSAIFWANGANVRVSGIRLQGPNGGRDLTDFARGLWSKYPGFTVDNCEIYNFPHAGIVLANGAISSKINHNYIHNCQGEIGYGIFIGGGDAVATIQGNLFDYDRHAIAAGGTPGNSYIAEYNTVLEHDGSGHSFDVHGGYDRRDGTNIAGTLIKIDHNTFKETYYRNIVIRGVPQKGAWIYNNWFYNSDTSRVWYQANAFGNIYFYNNLFGM